MERHRAGLVCCKTEEFVTMRKASFAALMAVLGVAQPSYGALPSRDQPGGWATFVDEQWGTRVEYPRWFSLPDGQPELGTGERRITPDRRAEIQMYSLPNSAHETPGDYLAEKLRVNPAELHYKRVTQRFFALSAAEGDKIYYTRCNFSQIAGGAMHCVYLAYPRSEKVAWDDIVTRVSFSLRP
jgi:hypothetical protein